MGKYSARQSRQPLSEIDKSPHAIWRGIGCLMIIIVPIISIALGVETINFGIEQGWPLPYQLMGTPKMPDWVYKVNILNIITYPIRTTRNFYAFALASLAYMLVLGGFVSMIYAFAYRIVGPAQYGPFDAPPPKIKTKRYTR